jgi:prolyl oligopeptidase PreP (S9A serine peptidase family)
VAWLEKGGVYVLANIRGGGEFGPRWHQAALKETASARMTTSSPWRRT